MEFCYRKLLNMCLETKIKPKYAIINENMQIKRLVFQTNLYLKCMLYGNLKEHTKS